MPARGVEDLEEGRTDLVLILECRRAARSCLEDEQCRSRVGSVGFLLQRQALKLEEGLVGFSDSIRLLMQKH